MDYYFITVIFLGQVMIDMCSGIRSDMCHNVVMTGRNLKGTFFVMYAICSVIACFKPRDTFKEDLLEKLDKIEKNIKSISENI
jgi:hypothetical protein